MPDWIDSGCSCLQLAPVQSARFNGPVSQKACCIHVGFVPQGRKTKVTRPESAHGPLGSCEKLSILRQPGLFGSHIAEPSAPATCLTNRIVRPGGRLLDGLCNNGHTDSKATSGNICLPASLGPAQSHHGKPLVAVHTKQRPGAPMRTMKFCLKGPWFPNPHNAPLFTPASRVNDVRLELVLWL
ncbi:hypothetical protein QQF64_021080 [Cirrhinus molitorella]|uniref:Uncharacterized protein n=1 Tax=Cirrhinus molitorella TaxID=172907 RepID=A0ABR3LCG9_9TELE